MTGSSFTTIGAVGVAFVGLANLMGVYPTFAGGAAVSGAVIGDKIAKISDSFVLTTAVVGRVSAAEHSRTVRRTAIPAWIWHHYILQLTPIQLTLSQGNVSDLTRAQASLTQLDDQLRLMNRKAHRIDVLVLLALVCDIQGDEPDAFENLSIALNLGSIGGNIRTFVDLGEPMANLLRRLKVKNGWGSSPKLDSCPIFLGNFSLSNNIKYTINTPVMDHFGTFCGCMFLAML